MKAFLRVSGMILVLLPATQGCMRLGPDYKRPEMGFRTPEVYQQVKEESASPASSTDRWWEGFNSPEINRLVAEVGQNNLDIRKSTAAVLELAARHKQTRSKKFPRLDLRADASRSQSTITEVTGITASSGGLVFTRDQNLYTADSYVFSLPASYELDLWGRIARSDEAARYDLLQAEESRRTLIQSLTAEAVSLFLEMESLERRIAVNQLKVENFRQTLVMIEKRYAAGLSSALEIRQTRRSLFQARAVLPTLNQALGAVQNRLSVLAARYPKTSSVRVLPEEYYKHLAPVPAGLPSELLLRRPDIRSAEASLAASGARIGEAKAARFPSINLTGTLGYSNSELGQLFLPESQLWKLAAGITTTLFDAGARKSNQKAAEARYEQQLSTYAKTVLNGFAEVENALLTREQQLVRREHLVAFLLEARITQDMALVRYEKGLVDYLTVLDAILARFRAEEDLILSDLALMQNHVSLCRALGGGWPVEESPAGPGHESSKKSS
ncbi:MAG: efflux transporter outer membrane subunit [Proteobacteria bacterium]|nr:efflux transporter outer membrane subunit [Pseudomonadota bacterium]MBU4472390.1 efflux transporter outer membrane subunit [Pseudomonadota bacterium]MCG2752086.1 efflux transporter outer membrane subunit [Desulfobacteraceae bacterium]